MTVLNLTIDRSGCFCWYFFLSHNSYGYCCSEFANCMLIFFLRFHHTRRSFHYYLYSNHFTCTRVGQYIYLSISFTGKFGNNLSYTVSLHYTSWISREEHDHKDITGIMSVPSSLQLCFQYFLLVSKATFRIPVRKYNWNCFCSNMKKKLMKCYMTNSGKNTSEIINE